MMPAMIVVWIICMTTLQNLSISGFLFSHRHRTPLLVRNNLSPLHSFVADGSDYSTGEGDFEEEEETSSVDDASGYNRLAADAPVVELKPVPPSKNSANRFVALFYDRDVDASNRDATELHQNRVEADLEHVMYCRKANLYNETFNSESMVDVVWSYPLLSSDLGRLVGHALCLDSPAVHHVREFLEKEPVLRSLTGGDVSQVPLFRWRHMKDHTLRMDSGRSGIPTLIMSMDGSEREDVRAATNVSHVQYLIRSERVVQAGPLHVCTETKDDVESKAVGDIVIFNAASRTHAIEFAENDPCAKEGLYETIRVHRFNDVDVSGKFVLRDQFDLDAYEPGDQMRDALKHWGYPVEDHQTEWINN